MTNCKKKVNIFFIILSIFNIFECMANNHHLNHFENNQKKQDDNYCENKILKILSIFNIFECMANNHHLNNFETNQKKQDDNYYEDKILKELKIKTLQTLHYVLDHEIGHAYVAVVNNVHVAQIKAVGFEGFVQRADLKGIVDLEILAGGMAMELDHGEEFLRLNQEDGDILLKKLNDYSIKLKKNKLILSNLNSKKKYKKKYKIHSDRILDGEFGSFTKEDQLIILKAFIAGVHKLYFKKKSKLFFYLKNSLIDNGNFIQNNIISQYSKSYIPKDIKISTDDILIALNLAKKYFPNYDPLKNVSYLERIKINQIMEEHMNHNYDLYFLDNKFNHISFVIVLVFILSIFILECVKR